MSFDKFLECRSIWLTLDGIQREVAKKSLQFISEDGRNIDAVDFEKLFYHRGCYSRFTNATDIKRAKTRCQKVQQRRAFILMYRCTRHLGIRRSSTREEDAKIDNINMHPNQTKEPSRGTSNLYHLQIRKVLFH